MLSRFLWRDWLNEINGLLSIAARSYFCHQLGTGQAWDRLWTCPGVILGVTITQEAQEGEETMQIRIPNIYIFTFYKPMAMSIIQLRSCVFDVVDARGQLRALSLIWNNHAPLSTSLLLFFIVK